MLDKKFESVCYLPLCHVAERSYSTVLHLITGGCVNFAESIDTVATNIREIAPTFFLGVPRIWEKLQQNFEFRMKDSGCLQRWLYRVGMRRGRAAVGPHARSKANCQPWAIDRLEFALWYALLFRNMQRHMGLNRTHTRMCGGASVSPETLRFFDIIGLPVGQGYGLTEAGGLCFVQGPGRPNIAGSCGPAMEGVEWKLGMTARSSCVRPASSRATCSTTRARATCWPPTAGWPPATSWKSAARRTGRGGPQEGHHHHQRRQEHRAVRDRERAEGQPLRARGHRRGRRARSSWAA
jgi:acyl-CoA synthetase (AMP-forming)/AMP-acid ligase II